MIVRFKKLTSDAELPEYAKEGDAGLDLYAVDDGAVNIVYDYMEYRTGLAVEIPEGYVGLIFPRSSISNYCLTLTNCVGVVDSGYRGEIKFRFKHQPGGEGTAYKAGDRIGQMVIMPYPQITPVWAETLTKTARGECGFGHTGD